MTHLFLLIVLPFLSFTALADSQILRTAAALKGPWQLTDHQRQFTLILTDLPAAAADGYQLYRPDGADLRQHDARPVLTAWRPAPDGISLLTADGMTGWFFARESADCYRQMFPYDDRPYDDRSHDDSPHDGGAQLIRQ